MTVIRRLRAQVRRRLLISYRVDPQVARGLVPQPFRPQLVDGSAVAGICMIGLTAVRPGWLHARAGLRSENVAHRVAVEWDEGGRTRSGVYITGRHSSSVLPVLAGGRLFPGVHRRARFALDETDARLSIAMSARNARIAVEVELGGAWTSTLFPTVDDSSQFYRQGSIGWSPRRGGTGVEALEFTSERWAVEGARVRSLRSSFFDALPVGSAVLDSALVMREVPFVFDVPLTPEATPPSRTAVASG